MVTGNNGIKSEIELAAYHESGHLIMAYFLKFKVEKIQILLNSDKTVQFARTRYLYDNLAIFANGIENIDQLEKNFSQLSLTMQQNYIGFARKRILILSGGPIAETLLLIGTNKPSSLNTEFRGPDLPRLEKIDKFLSNYDEQYEENILDVNMKAVTISFSKDIFWNSICRLATVLVNSENLCIYQDEIEKILYETEFIQYVDEQWK